VLFEDPDGTRLEINHVPGKGLLAPGMQIGGGYADGAQNGSQLMSIRRQIRAKCARRACAAYWATARTTSAAIGEKSGAARITNLHARSRSRAADVSMQR